LRRFSYAARKKNRVPDRERLTNPPKSLFALKIALYVPTPSTLNVPPLPGVRDGVPVEDDLWCSLFNHPIVFRPVYVGTWPIAFQLRALAFSPIPLA
jgi:hypothetical protein